MNRRQLLKTGFAIGTASALPLSISASVEPVLPIRLNANENSMGMAPSAREALLRGLGESNRYPFSEQFSLIDKIAELHSVDSKAIILGNGSSELLRLTVHLHAGASYQVVTADPTYEAVGGLASNLGLKVHRHPLMPRDYSHDLAAMRKTVENSPEPSIVYICNPNNPTGTLTSSSDLKTWMQEASEETLFLVDEAYHHYADAAGYFSFVELASQTPNLVVVRTFSKIYAMAGLRIGYAVSHPDFIARLNQLTRLNVNNLAISAAQASLDDSSFLKKSFESNLEAKRTLIQKLDELGLDHLPSHTNFVMFELGSESRRFELSSFSHRMRAEGLLVGRPFPPMLTHCRLSLGSPEEMRFFCEKLGAFRSKGWI